MKYQNPVIPGFHPDPSICRVGGDFYLVTSSFEYFPGVPVFHSRDLVNWRQIGHCLTRKSQLFLDGSRASMGIFAPTIRHHAGVFYMTTTNMTRGGNFYVTATDPAGEWSEPLWVDQPGIDPSLFFDTDGRVYFTSAANGITQCEIDIQTGKKLSESRVIWNGTGGAFPEGPHLYAKDGWYYLMVSEGGTELGHMMTIARSKDPFGPFEAYEGNPILSHRSLASPIKSTGHADLVQAEDGSWWAVCLATRPVDYPYKHHLGRETFLAPVVWADGGWPVIGMNGTIALEMEANLPIASEIPTGVSTSSNGGPVFSRVADRPEVDTFDAQTLAHCWNFLRNPQPEDWSLTAHPGSLTLHGSAVTLDDAASPAFVGRRLEHFVCTLRVDMAFSPNQDCEEAGLTVLMNNHFHYEAALKRVAGETSLIFRRRLGTLWREETVMPWPEATVTLQVDTDGRWFHFSAIDASGCHHKAGSGECGLLSTEVAGGFTGVYVGMYATGNGKQSTVPARFDTFTCRVAENQRLKPPFGD